MTNNDDWLRRILDDAAAEVEPNDRLEAIRQRTQAPARRYQPWLMGAVGVAAATAAVFGSVTALNGDDDTPNSPLASDPTPEQQRTADGWGEDPGSFVGTHAVPAYYLGEGPRGPVLFREFRRSETPIEGLDQGIAALMETPADPDYRTAWQAGDLHSAAYDGEEITVQVAATVAGDRPSELTPREAHLAVQQVVYTLQATVGDRAPVAFLIDEDGNQTRTATRVLGVATDGPVGNAPVLKTLSLVNITRPESNQGFGNTLQAQGVANSFEATVPWEILDADGSVVDSGWAQAEGWASKMLYPWQTEIDLSALSPGEYTFVARTDDPSGGAEGNGPFEDTKLFQVG
ncbi:Gmad2 immunoglobulin-like domain-containing protein [Nocardioides sp. Bht2]|uniref:Gmad2 immunoglobulin-like domain-containing protein n=1 Tax=Nocardioides sp. Bht2 TaxID=3392297 RepID=UPI0039B5E381